MGCGKELCGQARDDVRPLVPEDWVVGHAGGSCHLCLSNTDILVRVKTEVRI